MEFEDYAHERFADEEQNLGAYEADQDGIWRNAAFSDSVVYDEVNGIDVIGDLSEDRLYLVSTESAREVDADLPDRAYLDPTIEYQVDVEIMDRNGGSTELNAVILSGKSDQTSAQVWVEHAVSQAVTDEEIEYIEGQGQHSGDGDLNFLMDEEPEPTGLEALDKVK